MKTTHWFGRIAIIALLGAAGCGGETEGKVASSGAGGGGVTSAASTSNSASSSAASGGGASTTSASSGASSSSGTAGCMTNADCSDSVDCTVDTCTNGVCGHAPGPCPTGQVCNVLQGCLPGIICSDSAQCQMMLGGDPCKVGIYCDMADALCKYQTLDNDSDGHPPLVCGGDDCVDNDPTVHGGAPEVCDGKDNDCDGTADNGATCPGMGVCQAGVCTCAPADQCGGVCVDKTSDPANCGGCNMPCPPGSICQNSMCQCPPGSTVCSGQCVDTTSDPLHCGNCITQCSGGAVCIGSMCQCPVGLTLCGGQCVDTKKSVAHCGGCNMPCNGVCQNGTCMQVTCTPDLYIFQDQSGSMADAGTGGTKYEVSSAGINAFLADPASNGLGAGLGFHPLPGVGQTCMVDADCTGPFPICVGGICFSSTTTDSCTVADYAIPVVGIAPVPGVASSISASLAAHSPSLSSTPPPGLEGALQYAKTFAQANPTHQVSLVLLADDMPNECTTNTGVPTDLLPIAMAYANGVPKVKTYVIGLGTTVTQATWDMIAAAGGTGTAYVTDSAAGVQAALSSIRALAKNCN